MTRHPATPRRWFPRLPRSVDRRRSALPLRVLRDVQRATFRYRYRDVPTLKNPFDLALYMMLLSQTRPGTIVEIGSASGGSALWFASQCRGLGLDTRVLSLDLHPPIGLADADEQVTFLQGDALDLASSPLPDLLADAPRPLLVVEDGPHTFEASLAVLEFVHPYLQRGEYVVVEDGIVRDLGFRELRDGPGRAIRHFLGTHPGEYEIDRDLCDFFGRNVTWNPDGYLRRT